MASTQIIVNGYSVLGDPRVNANMSGSGNIMIHGGTQVFQPDDIIVVDVIGATAEGEITSSALINFAFAVAQFALLLHPMSRSYQALWFK